jgi:pyruvate formate lyase activating enzyme
MNCVEVCASGALSETGQWMTSADVVRKVSRYAPFYAHSDRGGVTISGGEPLYQAGFSAEIAKQCHEHGIHTAIETCGFADYAELARLATQIDLLLYDIKHMDDDRHRAGTRVGNKEILDNLRKVCGEFPRLRKVIRIPLVPGFNDDEDNVGKTVAFVHSLGIERLDLLPFNELPAEKYAGLGRGIWAYAEARRQPDEILERLLAIARQQGLKTTVGGLW